MKWLWMVGPMVVLFVQLMVVLLSTDEAKRRRAQLARWLAVYLGPLRVGGKERSRRVRRLPPELDGAVREAGGGARVADIALVPKHAYLAVREADGLTGHGSYAIVCRLARPAPLFSCRPLPVVDGRPVENRGLRLRGGDDLAELFVVEGQDDKAISAWLKPPLREALMEVPEAWLRVGRRTMSVALYGYADADRLDELLAVADAFFAAHGSRRSASLFGASAAKGARAGLAGYREPPAEARRGEVAAVAPAEPVAPKVRLWAGVIDLSLYGLAALLVAMVVGKFAWFHPLVLFNNPHPVVSEPWQGGWTTKGMGAFVAAATFLVGLFVYQSYLGASTGQSIGKRLLGARVVRMDGAAPGFARGLLRRTWLLAAVPLAVAAVLTRPFDLAAFLVKIPTLVPLTVGLLVVVAAGWLSAAAKDGRGPHDRTAGTRVVATEPFRIPGVQLGRSVGVDPVVFKQATRIVAVMLLWLLGCLLASALKLVVWFD